VSATRTPARGRRGRKPCLPTEVARLILTLHRQQLSLREIADRLNAGGIPRPVSDGPWQKKHVWEVLDCLYMRDLEEDLA
jgi:hypothetical protein